MKEKQQNTNAASGGRIRRVVLRTLLAVALVGLVLGGRHVLRILTKPEALFATATPVPTQAPLQPVFPVESVPSPEPAATKAPASDTSSILNVMLMGIDAYENGGTTSGSMPHTDVMMVIAVNFEKDTVDLITLPRDIMTTAPDHYGIYKLNGVFNVGLGGWSKPTGQSDELAEGFLLTCRAAEEWLGGVSVPYYFGLDFKAVMDVVDAIGGIDFDSEIDLYGLNGEIIAYRGQRHLNGDGALAYMRMRKTAGGLDYMRTARQRKMMVALFQKIKDEGQLSLIPGILEAMRNDLYTNVTPAQIAALVAFAADIDPADIRSYSIYGDMVEQYLWRYSMIDQQARIDILKEVYGIDAAPMPVDTPVYEKFLYDSGFMALQHLGYAKRLFAYVHDAAAQGELSEQQKKAYALCWRDYEALRFMFDQVDQWTRERYDTPKLPAAEQKQQLKYYQELGKLQKQLRTSGDALNRVFGLPLELKWTRSINDWFGKNTVINEVYVDFS